MINLNNSYLNRLKLKKKKEELISIFKKNKDDKLEKIRKHNENVSLLNRYNKINIKYEPKENQTSIIPLKVYTHWHSKELLPKMSENYTNLKNENPEFEFFLFDENDSRQFIEDNFDSDVLNTYNKLLPCAYKSDLWRYCVLYINGGIYLDIKFSCTNGFKLIELTDKEYFVRDIPEKHIYNALIVSLQKNEILLKAIYQIVENVKNNYYGNSCLEPTGPGLLGKYVLTEEINNYDIYHNYTVVENILSEYYLVYKNTIILKSYKEYRHEQSLCQKYPRYGDLWVSRNIYHK